MILIPYQFFDPPVVLDCGVTPIPASSSSPLQVIADTGKITGVAISFSDTTGSAIGVYMGAPGSEQLVCIIGNGVTAYSHAKIYSHSRISLRAMANQAINTGSVSVALLTTETLMSVVS